MLSEGEAEDIPDNTLNKTQKGPWDRNYFVKAVIPHNPDGASHIILDNHGSRFSTRAIDLSKPYQNAMLPWAPPTYSTPISMQIDL